ncbi:hypothetical protein Nepgr_000611 [Nepenthes gracilis]|uniref:DUF7895 domain-containing protein n=1 Tax=Nepenthes gracilis TaxID=150966 RepID=A0AAD3RVJ9_NEPGR|nr:hypothetical protein Nepgr_000611 [Nepenthes gracilis]
MELASRTLSLVSFSKVTSDPKVKGRHTLNLTLLGKGRKMCTLPSAMPEMAASVGIVAMIVGAASVLLVQRTRPSDQKEVPFKFCEDCSGSGICSECNGEGFMLKKMSEDSAEKARMASKNMATRYTAGLPKKWSYCTKCSSSRSCSTCGGSGRISL